MEDVFPIEHGDIFHCYVGLPEGNSFVYKKTYCLYQLIPGAMICYD